MWRCEEREARQEIFVVRLDAFSQTGARIARNDEADEHCIDIDLMFVRRRSTAKTAAIGKLRIYSRVKRNHVASRAIRNGNGTAEVDGIDDVEARPFERRHGGRWNAKRFVNSERFGIADQNGIENVRSEARHVLHRIGMQIQRLPLRSHKPGIEEREGVAADLHVIARAAKTGDNIAIVDRLRGLAADADPDAQQAVRRRRVECAIVWDAIRKQITRWNF